MMEISEIKLYQLLSSKLDNTTAEKVTSYIVAKAKSKIESKAIGLATKLDLVEVRKEIAQTKVDLIKWFVSLFITLALMILGLYWTFFSYIIPLLEK